MEIEQNIQRRNSIVCLNVRNVRQWFSFSPDRECPEKSQNVRLGTHGSLDKMSGEAQNDFAYSADKAVKADDKICFRPLNLDL